MTALALGQFIVRNDEPADFVPPEIIMPGPLVTRTTAKLESMLYLADPEYCML